MFVVAGITGNTGGAAVRALLEAGQTVRAIVRDPARVPGWDGVELVRGDTDDAATLARAFEGARGAYMLVPPQLRHAEPIATYEAVARAVRDAAVASGLGRLVFLSSESAHLASGNGPIAGLHRAEAILSGAVPELTFLRASFFQENWRAVFPLAREQGIMPTMLSDLDRARPMVATDDIGRTAAALLLAVAPPRVVELGGPADYSARDVAAAMASALGREVTPVQPPREAWVSILEGAGLGAAYAGLVAEMYDGINSGHVTFEGIAPPLQGVKSLNETFAAWAA